MREIECSLEASNYLMDSWPYTEPVLRALIMLRTSDHFPGEEIEAGLYRWETERHLIFYERKQPNLRILIIKPDADL